MGRPRTDIQPRILAAARARFLVDGVDGASLRTIARDAKTSIGMVFYYYPTKEALFLATVEEVYARILRDLEVILAEPRPVRERLARAFERFGSASPDELTVIRLVVREALLATDRFALLLERFRRGHVAKLLALLAEGAASGEIDGALPLPLLLVATLGIGGLPQVVRRVAGDAPPFAALPSPAELAQMQVDVLFGGIGAEGRSRPRKRAGRAPKERAPKKRPRPR